MTVNRFSIPAVDSDNIQPSKGTPKGASLRRGAEVRGRKTENLEQLTAASKSD